MLVFLLFVSCQIGNIEMEEKTEKREQNLILYKIFHLHPPNSAAKVTL